MSPPELLGDLAAVYLARTWHQPEGAPMPDLDPLTVPWYPVVNDLVGGWAIATADLPLSEIDTRTREVLIVGEFASESLARNVAQLHNAAIAEVTA